MECIDQNPFCWPDKKKKKRSKEDRSFALMIWVYLLRIGGGLGVLVVGSLIWSLMLCVQLIGGFCSFLL